jgi:nucleotide-binding universal stress UspA family protein
MNTVPRIVVGVDGFESSKAALRWAIHQAKLIGAVVDAVTTWHIPPASGLLPAADMPDYQDDARIILTEAISRPVLRAPRAVPRRHHARQARRARLEISGSLVNVSAAHGSRTRRPLALPCSTSAMASFTSASGLVS